MLRGMWGFGPGVSPTSGGRRAAGIGDEDEAWRAEDEAEGVGASFDICGIILRCRRDADLSQRDLAALLGVCPSTVARWESGARMPSAEALAAVAEISGYRLGLVDRYEAPVAAAPSDTLRDLAGRRMPAHLDVHLWDQDVWEPRPSMIKHVRSIHAPRRRWRDERRGCLSGRPAEHAPGCAPFHTLGWDRWCNDITTAKDNDHWRTAQRAEWDARRAAALALLPPTPEPEPCFCELECFEGRACPPECQCQCESYDVVVA